MLCDRPVYHDVAHKKAASADDRLSPLVISAWKEWPSDLLLESIKDDNYESALGVLVEAATASPTSMKTYYFCESGCHRPVLTYHSGMIASRPSNLRSVVLTSRMVARVGAGGGPHQSQNPSVEGRCTAQATSTCLVCGHNSVQSSIISQAATASSAEPPSQTGEYAYPCGVPPGKELDHTSGISYAR